MSAWDVIRARVRGPSTSARSCSGRRSRRSSPVDLPGSGQLASSIVFGRQRRSWTLPRGGSGALTDALVRFIEDHGGAVLCTGRSARLVLDGGRCAGVETDDGERFLAREAVVSTIHVKHLLDMAPADAWAEDFRYGVETFDVGLSGFAVYHATTEAPVFETEDGPRSAVSAGLSRLAAGHRRPPARAARRPLRRRRRVAARRHADARRPVARARGPPHGEVPQRPAVARRARGVDGRAQGPTGRAPTRARPRRGAGPDRRRDPRDARQEPGRHRGAEPRTWSAAPSTAATGRIAQSGGLRPRRGGRSTGCRSPASTRPAARPIRAARSPARPGRNAAAVLLQDLGLDLEEVVARCPTPACRQPSITGPRGSRRTGVDPNDFRTTTARIERWDEWLDAWCETARGPPRARARRREARRPRAHRRGGVRPRRGVLPLREVRVGGRRRAQPRDDRAGDGGALRRARPARPDGRAGRGAARRRRGRRQPAPAARTCRRARRSSCSSRAWTRPRRSSSTGRTSSSTRGMATLSLDGPGQGESGFDARHPPRLRGGGRRRPSTRSPGATTSTSTASARRASASAATTRRARPRSSRGSGRSPASAGRSTSARNWDGLPALTRETFQHHTGARRRRGGARARRGADPRRRRRAHRPAVPRDHRPPRPADPVGATRSGSPTRRRRASSCCSTTATTSATTSRTSTGRSWPTGCGRSSRERTTG